MQFHFMHSKFNLYRPMWKCVTLR